MSAQTFILISFEEENRHMLFITILGIPWATNEKLLLYCLRHELKARVANIQDLNITPEEIGVSLPFDLATIGVKKNRIRVRMEYSVERRRNSESMRTAMSTVGAVLEGYFLESPIEITSMVITNEAHWNNHKGFSKEYQNYRANHRNPGNDPP
jgi:hypothetical protein